MDVLIEWIGGWMSKIGNGCTDGCKVSDARWVDDPSIHGKIIRYSR